MKSILLVDDEPVLCAGLQRTLNDLGFRVETAHTVEAATRLARKSLFDAILVEINIKSGRKAHPRSGSGLQLVRQLRKSQGAVPILVYTAMEGELYETASLDAGADDFVQKTSSIASLASRIRAHMRSHDQGLDGGRGTGIETKKPPHRREGHVQAARK